MLNLKQIFGKRGEALAVKYLKKQGYEIICLNYRSPLGEIDVIAKDKDTLVFVEVKSRTSFAFGGAKHAVTSEKQRKISQIALYYLKSTGQMHAKARFDVVAVHFSKNKSQIEIIQNAFGLPHA